VQDLAATGKNEVTPKQLGNSQIVTKFQIQGAPSFSTLIFHDQKNENP